ncbi:MAG: haloacid dehalogenase [Anaerolineales bacterium]
MNRLEEIAERVHKAFETRTAAREQALSQARTLIRHASRAIRAVHRGDRTLARTHLDEAAKLGASLLTNLNEYPDLYYAGYSQDALKEYAEASIVYALLDGEASPTPEELGLEYNTYLKGLAEAVGEMRRRCLDILRGGYSGEAERLLSQMDDIYGILVTIDYPDAITGGLRRLTDMVRGVTERTRGDLTLSLRQEQLEKSLRSLESRLDG